MKFINTTPQQDEFLRVIVKYCLPPGLCLNDIREIKFDQTKLGFHGRAWDYGAAAGRTTIGVPAYSRYKKPLVSGGFKGYLPFTVYNWTEDLVGVVAHELRHLWQYKKRKIPQEIKRIRHHNLGTRADLGEVDASLYAKRKVREFRREYHRITIN